MLMPLARDFLAWCEWKIRGTWGRTAHQRSWQQQRACIMAYLTIIIHFISFMSHWKQLLKMDFFRLISSCSKVEILWPPCPLHLDDGEKDQQKDSLASLECDGGKKRKNFKAQICHVLVICKRSPQLAFSCWRILFCPRYEKFAWSQFFGFLC